MSFLKKEFKKNMNWSKSKVKSIANKLNLSQSSVYKWRWDYAKRKNLNIPVYKKRK